MDNVATPTLTTARPGDTVSIEGEPFVLWTPCGGPAPTLYCVTHQQQLANIGQFEMHTETGSHVIVARCRRHGWEPFQ